MATKRRKRRRSASVGRRVSHARKAVNPRRRRRSTRRRRNPIVVVARRRRRAARAAAPRRRRHSRRGNPSAIRVGQILKDAIYGAGGAIATRAAAGVAQGLIPGALSGIPFQAAILEAAIAVTLVRWSGKKFFGQQQGDVMMLGGVISAGLKLADNVIPNAQGMLTGIIRAPVSVAPGVQQAQLAGMNDVYEVPGFRGLNGFGDVYDVQSSLFPTGI